MKRKFLFALGLSLTITATSFAQVSGSPEVPKNYKPEPKELLPMPGELTDEMIFPVLGKYEYATEDSVIEVTITRDGENKGTVWVNGMPQGRFKADLRNSPATYKIAAQKTLINEIIEDSAAVQVADETEQSDARYSGNSIKEGTLLFDSTSNKLYVNLGHKFNEEEPAAVFPELQVTGEENEATVAEEPATATKNKDKKEAELAGTNYVLTKITELAAASID